MKGASKRGGAPSGGRRKKKERRKKPEEASPAVLEFNQANKEEHFGAFFDQLI